MTNIKENKKHYNERGFTLVELLAVIVVLAIVMLIAVNAVLPRMEEARKQAFLIEANGLIKSAQQYIVTASLTGDVNFVSEGEKICITADELVTLGHSSLDKNNYDGRVIVTKAGNIYLYSASLRSKAYQVVDKGVDTTTNSNVTIEVGDVAHADATSLACPTNTETPAT